MFEGELQCHRVSFKDSEGDFDFTIVSSYISVQWGDKTDGIGYE